MKFITLHLASSEGAEMLVNPLAVAFVRHKIDGGAKSVVMHAGVAYPVVESIEEIRQMIGESLEGGAE